MRIPDLYAKGQIVYSFEFFPPRTEAGVRSLMRTLEQLRALGPDFVSVTHPLDRSRRHLTLELVARIKRDLDLEAMAHMTCVNASRDEMHGDLEQLASNGIENVLALRGDPPEPDEIVVPESEWFPYASDLVAYIRAAFPFSVGGAAHPEVHPEARDAEDDLRNLRTKVDAGCDFLITQLFFANADYFRFVERAHAFGVDVPIVPGIMPVTSVSGIKRMVALSGQKIPSALLQRLERAEGNDEKVEEIGVEWARRQCEELVARGAPGIHFYTLNRSKATRRILTDLRSGS
jgi:methylenetetrahydrofolate reductase (NADPH)